MAAPVTDGKLWRRGQPIADATIVYEGNQTDVVVSPVVFQSSQGTIALVTRAVNFFENEYFLLSGGEMVKLPLPNFAELRCAMGDQLIAILLEDWTQEGATAIPQGSLIGFPLNAFLATRTPPRVEILYAPGIRTSVDEVAGGRDAVYASIFENVTGSVHAFKRDAATGAWRDVCLHLPAGGSTGIVWANDFGPEAYFTYQGFLVPTTLYSSRGDEKPAAIKSLPPRFDASPYRETQYEAISKDETRIPYFVVRGKETNNPVPMILEGYGGFNISQTPSYLTSIGQTWLPKGGAYSVANIRGGGEFGPAWHDAALKTNRQKAYDDFIAVAEDMVMRGLTTPAQLGILGASNGGLLVGAVAVQRPDLFGAVVCEVPLLDMIRYMKLGAGSSWEAEYGNPDTPEERAAILKYSPYQNVKAGVKYPSMFFVTATSDDRVTPVHARKMAAKMEAQGHDVLFYENTDGGHDAAANHKQQAERDALTFVYLTQQLGVNAPR